ncbi:MAG: STAS domain-containing protein [bacterium]
MKPFDLKLTQPSQPTELLRASVSGYLDAHTVLSFEQRMEEQLQAGCSKVILDIGELSYISSAGIGAMMGLAQKLRSKGGDLVLVKPSEKVFKILELLGFTRIFRIASSDSDAVETLKD